MKLTTTGVTRIAITLVIAVAAVAAAVIWDVPTLLRTLLTRIENLGALGVVLFIALYIAATVFFVPGSILTLGAGFVFGVVAGSVWVSIASTLGSFAAFLTGRYLARGWVTRTLAAYPRFAAIDAAVAREGWKIVLLTRLSPIFPYNLLNYAYGVTGVPAIGYFFASWIGMFPATVMYVYIGSLAADIATLGADDAGRGPLAWALYGLGFAATVAVTVLVTRVARRALTSVVDAPGEASV